MTDRRRQPPGLVEAFGQAAAQPLTLLTTVLLAGACADGDTTDDRWAGTRDTVATIEVVRNPAKPLRQADRVTVAELWDAANTGPRGIWESPRAIAVGTGTVYVLDEQAHSVYRLEESTGADLGTIGRRGAGPGEFERPFAVGVVDGHLMVGSRAGPRIDLFTAEGAYERRLRIDFLVFGIEALGDDRLLLTGMEGGSGVTRLIDLDGDVEPFEHPWRDFQVRDDRLFALAIDPGTGLGRVIAYRLALPEGIRSPLTVP